MENIEYNQATVLSKMIERAELDRSSNQIDMFDIRPGMTVIDYSCSHGKNLKNLSKRVGENGEVISIETDFRSVKVLNRVITKSNLRNVEMSLATEYDSSLPDDVADVIIISSMLCKTRRPGLMLKEIRRLLKNTGTMYIDLNSQSKEEVLKRIEESYDWTIVSKHNSFLVCV